ncbi:MAG: hypothetical protein IBJ10_01190 [Phycisphaerales bacterium]|nr:hypothetical protein [Phycisphaerales bacterium]
MPAPSTPPRALPAWSKSQTIMLLRAATCAGWNDAQRHIAMRHAGCPNDEKDKPSVKHPRNTQAQFEIVMALAEAQAAERHALDKFPLPNQKGVQHGVRGWRDVAAAGRSRSLRFAEAIWAEAAERIPEIFGKPSALRGFIARQTRNDPPSITLGREAEWLGDLDEGQLYRVTEGLRAWVGREFLVRDIEPKSFRIPPHVRRQLERSSRGH